MKTKFYPILVGAGVIFHLLWLFRTDFAPYCFSDWRNPHIDRKIFLNGHPYVVLWEAGKWAKAGLEKVEISSSKKNEIEVADGAIHTNLSKMDYWAAEKGSYAPVKKVNSPPPQAPQTEEVFKVVEEMPRFPAQECEALSTNSERKKCADQKMMDFVYRRLRYPIAAEEQGIECVVVVHFTITSDGSITDIEVVRDIGGGCGDEARRVVELIKEQLGKWIPGRQRGRPVTVRVSLPVRFRLEGG